MQTAGFSKAGLLLILFSHILSCTTGILDIDSALIAKAVNNFQQFSTVGDLISGEYEVFTKRNGSFASNQWQDKIFQNVDKLLTHSKNTAFLINKSEDGLHPSEINTHIILIRSPRNKVEFTAHKAYIRTIEGVRSVEWDFYEPRSQLSYTSFFTAVTPSDYFHSRPNEINNRKATRTSPKKERVYDFLSHLKDKVKNVACLVAEFIPGWCEKSDRIPLEHLDQPSKDHTDDAEVYTDPDYTDKYQGFSHENSNENVKESISEEDRNLTKSSNSAEEYLQENLEENANTNPSEAMSLAEMNKSDETFEEKAEQHFNFDEAEGNLDRLKTKISNFKSEQPPVEKLDNKSVSTEEEVEGAPSESTSSTDHPKGRKQSETREQFKSGFIKIEPGINSSAPIDMPGESLKHVAAKFKYHSEDKDEKILDNPTPLTLQDSVAFFNTIKEHTTNSDLHSHISQEGDKFEHPSYGKFKHVNKTKAADILNSRSFPSYTNHKSPKIVKKPKRKHKVLAMTRNKSKTHSRKFAKMPMKKRKLVSNKFICPSGSGAVLRNNRCYCPIGTVLLNRKCLNTTQLNNQQQSSQTHEVMFTTIHFRRAKAKRIDNAEVTVEKRQTPISANATTTEVFSFDPDIAMHPWLGHFYAEQLQVHFSPEKATALLTKFPRKDLEFFKDRYRIRNNKETGHPEFESKILPFTGIMDCKYKDRKFNSFGGALEENIVDYFLHALRAQCHKRLRKNTLKLFDRGIVFMHKKVHNYIIELNDESELLKKSLLNKRDWQDFISAIFLAKFSEAFSEQKMALDKGIDDSISPDRKHITLTAKTLTVMVEKVMQLLKQKQFQVHAVKITKALVATVSEYLQNSYKQEFIVKLFCKRCEREDLVYQQVWKQLHLLSDYIMFGFQDVLMASLTFDEFYNSILNSEENQ